MIHECCGCPFLYSTCTPPVFVFSALNNSHYFLLYSMTHNLVNSLHGDLPSGTAITCLRQIAYGLFISTYHINAQSVCYSNLYISPAIPGIPRHGSWCLHSQNLQLWNTSQSAVTEWKDRTTGFEEQSTSWKADSSSVYRPLTVSLWSPKVHCHINPVQYPQHILLGFIRIRILPSTSWSTEVPHPIRFCDWIFFY